jgi:hypothetical protein
MRGIKISKKGVPLPRISRLRVFADFRVSVLWAEGSRTGAADTVDLAPVIDTYKLYRPLRNNKKLFQTARLVDDGSAIAWGDGTIDMPAEMIEDIADQAMALSPKDFASTGPIPRVEAPARHGREARQEASDPASSLSARGGGGRAGWLSELRSRGSQDEPARSGGRAGWLSGLLSRAPQDEPAPGGYRAGWISEVLSRASQNEPARKGRRAGGRSEPLSRVPQNEPARSDGRAGWRSEPFARAPQDAPAPGGGRASGRSEPLAPAPQDEPAPGGARAGGVSDPLARAPQQDEPAWGGGAPARDPDAVTPDTVESLDALAVNVARMVDDDAVPDVWDRYNRGEGSVFTRMLYTMQGQEAFEEVRRRYRGDRDFMRTVDRYIGEFERLVRDVSSNDHGQLLARNYLTSETGEVYIMLAHAAGRFERSGLRGDEYTIQSRWATSPTEGEWRAR